MRLAEHEGYLLEVRAPIGGEVTWSAWVSRDGSVLGYAGGMSRTEAIDAALRSWNTARKPIERALREKAVARCPKCGNTANLETDQNVSRYSCEACELNFN